MLQSMVYRLLAILILLQEFQIRGEPVTFFDNGIILKKAGPVIRDDLIGDTSLFLPLFPMDDSFDNCTGSIRDELIEIAKGLFPNVTMMKGIQTIPPRERFVAEIMAGVAIGIAAGAMALAGVALAKSVTNAKNIQENRAAINDLRRNVDEIKQGFDYVSQIVDQTVITLARIEAYINTEIVPLLERMECDIQKNTMRVKVTQFWLKTIADWGPILQNPYTEQRIDRESGALLQLPGFQQELEDKWGISPDGINPETITLRFGLVECTWEMLNIKVMIYRQSMIPEVTVFEVVTLPILGAGGNPQIVGVSHLLGEYGGEFYQISEHCIKETTLIRCDYFPLEDRFDVNCSSQCPYIPAKSVEAYSGDGNGGVLVNCEVMSCVCDRTPYKGYQHFINGSCNNLILNGRLNINLRDPSEIRLKPVEIQVARPGGIRAIDLSNNISSINQELKDTVSKIGNHVLLKPLAEGVDGMMVWLICLTVLSGIEGILLLVFYCKIKKWI